MNKLFIKDFIQFDKEGVMYQVIDATQQGYLVSPKVLIEADRNVVINRFGDYEIVGFGIKSKTTLRLYVKSN